MSQDSPAENRNDPDGAPADLPMDELPTAEGPAVEDAALEAAAEEAAKSWAGETAPGADQDATETKPSREEVLQQVRTRRERSQRRMRFLGWSIVVLVLAVVAFFTVYQLLYHRYRALYNDQPWLQIRGVYKDMDAGRILEVHHDRARRELDRRWMDTEVYFVGVFTGRDKTKAGVSEFLVDVPVLREPLNFYDDDIHFEDGDDRFGAVAVEKGDIVFGRGRVKHFSQYVFRLEGLAWRKASFIEAYFYREWTANLSLDREPIGVQSILQE